MGRLSPSTNSSCTRKVKERATARAGGTALEIAAPISIATWSLSSRVKNRPSTMMSFRSWTKIPSWTPVSKRLVCVELLQVRNAQTFCVHGTKAIKRSHHVFWHLGFRPFDDLLHRLIDDPFESINLVFRVQIGGCLRPLALPRRGSTVSSEKKKNFFRARLSNSLAPRCN